MLTADGERNPLEELAEEFIRRQRRGERVTIDEFAKQHPDLAGEIRDLFPALALMERIGEDSVDSLTSPAAPAGNFKTPERLGDFRLLREIGRGGMGVVYEAEQESLGRRVAVKVIHPSRLVDPRWLQRFEREARAAAALHHTNIVPVFGVGEEAGFHYYVMQNIQGQGLDAVFRELQSLRQQPADSAYTRSADATATFDTFSSISTSGNGFYRRLAQIGAEVAEALEHAFRQGILHRDVKPSNLLLDLRGSVWVTDFGLAKVSDSVDLTMTGDLVGTLRYMAPERFRGECTIRSDLYGLGLTLYELSTLRRPTRSAIVNH